MVEQPALLHEILDAQASLAPDRPGVRRRDTTWTYAQLRDLSLAHAAWYRRLGVGRGDRILVCAPHDAETVATLYAASRLGALYVIVSDRLPEPVLSHVLRDSEPKVVVATGAVAAAAAEAGAVTIAFADLDARPADFADGPACLSIDPVSLIYTSGSTAMPKAVVSTHHQVLFAAQAIHRQLRYRPDDVVFSCLPLSFDYGLYQAFLACLAGATLCLGDAEDAGLDLLRRLTAAGTTVLPAVPSLASILLALVIRSGKPPAGLRMLTNTGAHLAVSVSAELRARIPGLTLVPMFGLTECKRVSIMEPDGDLTRPGSVGRPLPGTEAFVVDEHDRRLAAGHTGELVVRGPHVMSGYWRAPELTAQRFGRDEHGAAFLRTGDQCRMDADGYLYFVGRRDDIYKQNGFRVSTVEVEAAAAQLPGVRLAAVLPPGAGRECAVLVVAGDIDRAVLLQQVRDRLERHKAPATAVVLDELPLGVSGKVDKKALASLIRERAELEGAGR